MQFVGELAALGTALGWAGTSLFFAAAGRRIGSFQVNQVRIVMAVVLLAATHLILCGSVVPAIGAEHGGALALLVVSGLIGLVLGDTAYFRALVDIGPRLASVTMATYPLIAAVLAWIVAGERIGPLGLLGMACSVTGVVLAIAGRRPTGAAPERPKLWPGLFYGLLGATCQAVGILVAKAALDDPLAANPTPGRFDPLAGTLIRMLAAMAALWAIAATQVAAGRAGKLRDALRHRSGMLFTLCGAICGPFIGVWLSLIAIQNAPVGIATTIMATAPILVIPQIWLFAGERPGRLEVVGALLAVAGVALLFARA